MNETDSKAGDLAEELADAEPLCGPAEFDELIQEMVADDAPRRFAVVEVLGERFDARVAAWGLAFDDHAELSGVDGGVRMSLRTPDRALIAFRGPDIRASIVWVDSKATAQGVDTCARSADTCQQDVDTCAGGADTTATAGPRRR